MNKNISRLSAIAEKDSRLIIGLMSGTSLDGLDIALCDVKGSGPDTKLNLKEFATISYDDDLRNEVKEIFSKRDIDLQKLCLLNDWIGTKHASMINGCLNKWQVNNSAVDLIASHGQTIYHAPKKLHKEEKFGNATLQIGDADHIAVATGIITISDFRQKHIAAGGEGAPLAMYGDHILFSKKDEDRILLNIGGISNCTWLPGDPGAVQMLSSDIGPGNTMMDAFIQQHFPGKHFDDEALIAGKGTVNEKLLSALKDNGFFAADLPKTTGPELFNLSYLGAAIMKAGITSITAEDTMRTLNKFTADTIAETIKKLTGNKTGVKIFSSGGGVHNPLLMLQLKEQLSDHSFHSTETLGIDPDAKEAVLFAVLANECICGDASVFVNKNINMPAISMGKISFPY